MGGCGTPTSVPAKLPHFTARHLPAGGQSPFAVAVADFDGDGRPDLAVSLAGSDSVGLLLSTAPGVFAPGPSFTVESVPRGLAAADLDGDGRADLIVAPAQSSSIAIVLGAGQPGARVQRLEAGSSPFNVAVADLDGDGHLDIAVANESNSGGLEGRGQTSVLFGDGRGGFPRQVVLEAGTYPADVKIADLDGDGHLDLAVVNWGSHDLSLFLGHGVGAFSPARLVPCSAGPAYALSVLPRNGGGRPDLVVADAGGVIDVVRSRGNGELAVTDRLPAGAGVRALAVADLNGDRWPDVATADTGAGTISVLLGGPAGFLPAQPVATARRPRSVAAADLDGDGRIDLAVTDADAGEVVLLLNGSAH